MADSPSPSPKTETKPKMDGEIKMDTETKIVDEPEAPTNEPEAPTNEPSTSEANDEPEASTNEAETPTTEADETAEPEVPGETSATDEPDPPTTEANHGEESESKETVGPKEGRQRRMTIAQRNLLAQGNRNVPYPYVGGTAFIKVVGIDPEAPNTFHFVYSFNGQLFQAKGKLHNTSVLTDPTEDGSVTKAARQAAHEKMCGKGIFLFAIKKGRDGQNRYLLDLYETVEGWPQGGVEGKTDPSIGEVLKSAGHLNSFAPPPPRPPSSFGGFRGRGRGSFGGVRGRGRGFHSRGRGRGRGSFRSGSFRGPRGNPSPPSPMFGTPSGVPMAHSSPMSPSPAGQVIPHMTMPPSAMPTSAYPGDSSPDPSVVPTSYMSYMDPSMGMAQGMAPYPYGYMDPSMMASHGNLPQPSQPTGPQPPTSHE